MSRVTAWRDVERAEPEFARRVSWRWYSFDPGTLRLADAHCLLGHHQRFGYFSKTGLPSILAATGELRRRGHPPNEP
jgi:hypothetical protein